MSVDIEAEVVAKVDTDAINGYGRSPYGGKGSGDDGRGFGGGSSPFRYSGKETHVKSFQY